MTAAAPRPRLRERMGAGRSSLRLLGPVVWVVIGVLVGAALGALLGSNREAVFRAETVFSVLPETQISSQALGGASGGQDATAFIQSELVVLNGPERQAEVQRELGLDSPPAFSSSQVGLTFVIRVSGEGASPEEAVAVVAAVADGYAEERRASLGSDLERASASVEAQLEQLSQTLLSPQLAPSTVDAEPTQVVALREEYGRLLSVSSALNLATGQVERAVSTLQPPAVTRSGALSPTLLFALGGALLGALVASGARLAFGRTSGRLQDAADLEGLGVPVLLPALPAVSTADLPGAVMRVAREARLLAARAVPAAGWGRTTLVLFGTTSEASSGFVAAALAGRLAERGPVLLVLAGDVVRPGMHVRLGLPKQVDGLLDLPAGPVAAEALRALAVPSALPGVNVLARGRADARPESLQRLIDDGLIEAAEDTGWTVVIDAPPLDRSLAAVDLSRRAGGGVLVVGRGRSRARDVLAARDILQAQVVALVGVVLAPSQPAAPAPGPTGAPARVGRQSSTGGGWTRPAQPAAARRDGTGKPVRGPAPLGRQGHQTVPGPASRGPAEIGGPSVRRHMPAPAPAPPSGPTDAPPRSVEQPAAGHPTSPAEASDGTEQEGVARATSAPQPHP